MPSEKNRPQNNPYASASGKYAQHAQDVTDDPREVEARVLLKAVRKMQVLQDNWDNYKPEDLEEVLRYNRTIWMMFVDNVRSENSGHTVQVRSNISNLGQFIFKHSLEILIKPEKDMLNILMKINRQIATGLMTKPPADAAAAGTAAKTQTEAPKEGGKFSVES